MSMTGNPGSTMARVSDVHLDISVAEEACPLNLAPTASTTATLAMGDALAVALLKNRGFTAEDFARSHPSGNLGKRLLLRVGDVMHGGDRIPAVSADVSLRDALLEMTAKGLGMTAVVDTDNRILGIFTDGDLRRTLEGGVDPRNTPIDQVMTAGCVTASPEMLAAEGLKIMEQRAINALLITDGEGRLCGAMNMHDMLRAGVL